MKISYAVLCSTELEETKTIVEFLLANKRKEDEVVVVQDEGWNKLTVKQDRRELFYYLADLAEDDKIKFEEFVFNNNFSEIKNYLNS